MYCPAKRFEPLAKARPDCSSGIALGCLFRQGRGAAQLAALLALVALTPAAGAQVVGNPTIVPQPAGPQSDGVIKRLQGPSEKLEMTVNTSRILTLDTKIPRALVNNPDILTLTALSPNQMQVAARKPGITQVNLWDEHDQIYTIDVMVLGDAAELEAALKTLYPNASIKVSRFSNSLVLSGYVDRPEIVSQIARMAEDYSPKVINDITVGGVQQILLNVQVYEVSRTRLRRFGFDFANINGSDFIASSIGGMLTASAVHGGAAAIAGTGDTIRFGIVDGGNAFFGFIDALRQQDMMKVLAEPKLVTTSGRPAAFQSGGEFPILVPQSLGTVSIQYKKFGTQVDFLPVVLGNGNIRLEVRPRVSEIDNTRSVVVNSFTVPGLRTREVDTAVEMKAGQTLALAGLIQNRTEAKTRAIPWLGEMPWVGAAFRRVEEANNEIELLILVRPEFVDPLDPHEAPTCLPGMGTASPGDVDLYWRGHIEVPACNGCGGVDCQHCNPAKNGVAPNGSAPYEEIPPGMNTPVGPPADPLVPAPSSTSRRRPAPSEPTVARPVSKPVPAKPVAAPASPVRKEGPREGSYAGTPAPRLTPPNPPASSGGIKKPALIGPLGYDLSE